MFCDVWEWSRIQLICIMLHHRRDHERIQEIERRERIQGLKTAMFCKGYTV